MPDQMQVVRYASLYHTTRIDSVFEFLDARPLHIVNRQMF